MLNFPKKTDGIIAGIDEAGRGCLSGPVVAAAVILPPDSIIEGLNDSKQIHEKQRSQLRHIIETTALAFGIGVVAAPSIDSHNILQATFMAMHEAINQLKIHPERLLIDGNRYKPAHLIPYQTIIQGDGKIAAIAAASILAKTYRDDIMKQASYQFPQYQWNQNKGYPTAIHKAAVTHYGTTIMHRLTFRHTKH